MSERNIDIKGILSDVFKVEKDKITADTNTSSLREWDSLSHVALIVKLEEKLNVRLSPKEASRIISVRDILKILKKNELFPKSKDLLAEYKHL